MKKCDKCGQEVAAEASSCSTCGAPVSQTSSQPAKGRSHTGAVILFVCLLLGLLLAVYAATREKDTSSTPNVPELTSADIESLRTKAEKGDANAQNDLGVLYAKGR